MKIVTDSSVMFTIEQGAAHGIEVLPLSVSINGRAWAEYEEMSADAFLDLIREGYMPTSSSPSPEATLSAYDTDEEVLHLTMAAGLSGTYEVACGLKAQARHPERIHVVNSKTLCVPQRALALCAAELAKCRSTVGEVLSELKPLIDSAHSYLLPEDFDYLRRGGRLTPLAAKVVHLVRAEPVMRQTEDGMRLERLVLARNFKKGVDAVIADMKKRGVGEGHYISVSHADNAKDAHTALERLKNALPKCRFGVFELGPAFITQGGPLCVAIQSIDMSAFGRVVMD